MGLARGYREVELDLSLMKPYLRSQMEARFKAIKSGQITKEEVLREMIAAYRAAFVTVEGESDKLYNALRATFAE
ncbi:hypothetical protein HDU97_007668 [Phlyctochytrium planicorne]|nr:hypothetical protein HDU97_007668 [Phlyctochytrium planicorne]